ncbi:protein SIEVE ELEMENT OCCLUSION B [Cajanus cajan]|uniref:protein SIEVE ELEMENT OCCLUSION B n=1 Tax=Cajanus cajan TaxID=3821 RepID=UPI00098DB46A|nr:protein SIEVE ELEMENT OCCLUSION B [Cajanus cajan]
MSTTKTQQKPRLPNPFNDLSDSEIIEKVYLSHTYDDEVCNKETLFKVVSNVITLSTRVVGTMLKTEEQNGFIESTVISSDFKPEFSTLKLMSCQMMTTVAGLENVHQTTLRILQQLRTFSWDAKALIALAAFSLEYGNFLNLYQASDYLGNSLKALNQIQHRLQLQVIDLSVNTAVKLVLESVQKINLWGTWSSDERYDTEDVPALSDALHQIPLVVYWAVATLVACNSNIQSLSDYSIKTFSTKLSTAVEELSRHLVTCELQRAIIFDYLDRKRRFRNPKGIVDFLKLLIHQNGSQNAQIYDGNAKKIKSVDVFKEKHVLLFISGLDRIEDEIRLLNSIDERLVEDPNEKSGYKKEEFKILWIPIENVWGGARRELLGTLKDGIRWYVVEYVQPLPGIRLIEEDLNFRNKPILPVVNPQGVVVNYDALDIIFEWGIDAFPFRKSDGDRLAQKWKWFWDEIRKTNLNHIQVKGDRYIFIYGGSDKWTQEFTLAVDKIKRHPTIRNADVIIDYYHLGKDDPKIVPRFWIGIEGKRQRRHYENLEPEIQEFVKSLLCLKQDIQGWAILTKGSNVKIPGHAQPMYQTVAEFDSWKDKVLVKEGFDIAFQEYYEVKREELPAPQPCAYMNIDNYASNNVLATITCPNASCGRVMEVTSVNYKCCHGNVSDKVKV